MQQLDAYFDVEGLVQGNALQVDVNQPIVDRLALPVNDHGFGARQAGHFDVEDRVVAGL